MLNVDLTYSPDEKKLYIEIDMEKELGKSASGKTIVVASTKGNKAIEGTECYIGLNVYKYPKKEE